jgi:hypothetical protein
LRITSGHSFDHLVGAGGQFGADNFDFASYDIELAAALPAWAMGQKRTSAVQDALRWLKQNPGARPGFS